MILKSNITEQKQITNLLEWKNKNYKNSILLSDLIQIYQNKYRNLKERINNYSNDINKDLKKDVIQIISFDYSKNQLIIAYMNGWSLYRMVYPNIIEEPSLSHLDSVVFQKLQEIYDLYLEYRSFFTEKITCQSINTESLINITYRDVSVVLNNGLVIQKSIHNGNIEFHNQNLYHDSLEQYTHIFSYIKLDMDTLPTWIKEEYQKQEPKKIKKRIFPFRKG